MGSLEEGDRLAAEVQKTPNRVTLEWLNTIIVNEEYIRPINIRHMTICVLTVANGFAVVGQSAPADLENYNKELGERFAKEDAVRKLWPLEAYALRERMTGEAGDE